MKILFRPGGDRWREVDVGQFTVQREHPFGPPLWKRILLILGLCALWVFLCIDHFTS